MSMLKAENHWVLVDYPLSQQAVVEAANQQLQYQWWYADTALQDALEVSPLWIKVTNAQQAFKQDFPQAPAFITTADDEQFIQHIKSLCLMRNPNGKPFVIRFYEPDYLTKWVAKLSQERLAELLGPIEQIDWFYSGKEQTLRNPSQQNSPSKNDIAWFQLTESEWTMLTHAFNPS